jgi:carnitine O-palmitoyltransferase 2
MSLNNRNQKSLDEIDTALFVMGLDDDELGEDPVRVTRAFLHSDGSNRWFDKSFNLILSKDGWAGLNFEHAWGDGVAVMRFFNEIHADSLAHKWSNTVTSKRPLIAPIKLHFELDAKTKQGIEAAQKRLNSHADSLQIHPFVAENYGKKECKKWGISPDSVMQLGFQAAHFHLFNKAGTTYESCSTSAFKHGRTEAIRPATLLTNEVSRALTTSNWRNRKPELRELIKQCSIKHGELTKNAAMGQGFDRHLYALKVVALSQGLELPDLYKDEAYRIINHNILSTSTLSSPAVRVGGFGPVVSDGYGIAYQIWEGGLGCLTTSYKGGKDAEAFAQACEIVFKDIGEVMRD